MSAKVCVVLADGFEEIEAVSPIDVGRRAGFEVVVAGLGSGPVRGARGVHIAPDVPLDAVDDEALDAIVLPGGSEGARNLAASARLRAMCEQLAGRGALLAAICAAPAVVLGPWGLLDGYRATCYPSLRGELRAGEVLSDPVVVDRDRITGAGPAVALPFALAVARKLAGPQTSDEVARAMLYEAGGDR